MVPKLKLKWAFNLGKATMARSQPAMVAVRLFVGIWSVRPVDQFDAVISAAFAIFAMEPTLVAPGLRDRGSGWIRPTGDWLDLPGCRETPIVAVRGTVRWWSVRHPAANAGHVRTSGFFLDYLNAHCRPALPGSS